MSKAVIEIEEVDGQLNVNIEFVGGVDMNSAAHEAAIEMVSAHATGQGISEEELTANMIASMEVVRE